MSVRRFIIASSLVAFTSIGVPKSVSADWLFTPFIGSAFNAGADFGDTFDEPGEFERRFTYGASLGYMGAGIAGFEIDFGYSPNFFETLVIDDDDFTFADDSNVTTLMFNILLGAPIGGQGGPGIRPYAVGGLGLIRTHVTEAGLFFEDLDSNDWGFNLGAGLHGFFSDSVGVRADIRYFRAFAGEEDEDLFAVSDFDFWRASIGVTFRFGGS